MRAAEYVAIGLAFLFYAGTWLQIRQLVKEVNAGQSQQRFTALGWTKNRWAAWAIHARLYPDSRTRKGIVVNFCASLSCGVLWLVLRVFDLASRHAIRLR
jgi:hypothetical protein